MYNLNPNTIEHLKSLCLRFENGEFSIEELQSRLRTIIMIEPPIPLLDNLLHDIDNQLELIRFTKLESNQRECSLKVLEQFKNQLQSLL